MEVMAVRLHRQRQEKFIRKSVQQESMFPCRQQNLKIIETGEKFSIFQRLRWITFVKKSYPMDFRRSVTFVWMKISRKEVMGKKKQIYRD